MLKPSLQLRIGQQLTMTPQLQQAIRLLQLPSLDLQAHVRETLETNVMLEAEDELALEAPEAVREREDVPPEDAPPEEKYAELDGNTIRPGRAMTTAAATSATSTARPCRSSSSSSSSSPSSRRSTSRSHA
jgi:DNA-directed RNA polymerase specialized sigma54-like protein